jgi:hypothetical protein
VRGGREERLWIGHASIARPLAFKCMRLVKC